MKVLNMNQNVNSDCTGKGMDFLFNDSFDCCISAFYNLIITPFNRFL